MTALKPTPAFRVLYGVEINTGPNTPLKLEFRDGTPILLDLVETGEDSALLYSRVDSLVKERRAYGIEFMLSPGI